MRTTLLTLLITLISLCGLMAQNITVSFTGKSQDNAYMRLDSIKVYDLSQHWERTLTYPDTVMIAILNSIESQESADFSVSQNTPNPFNGRTEVAISIPYDGTTTIQISDINGRIHAQSTQNLNAGTHKFDINLAAPQTYILSASINGKTSSIKMINTGKGCANSISYLGQTLQQKLIVNGLFELGDDMKYIGYTAYGGILYASYSVTQRQYSSEDITLVFPISINTTPVETPDCQCLK